MLSRVCDNIARTTIISLGLSVQKLDAEKYEKF